MFRKFSLKVARKLHPYRLLEDRVKLLERGIEYYDVRIDSIYKSLLKSPDKSNSVADDEASKASRLMPFTSENDLYAEDDRSQLSKPSLDQLKYINPHLTEDSKEYFNIHWKRIFETLMRLDDKSRSMAVKKVLEVGPSDIYQSKLREIFKGSKFSFIGKPFINERISSGFDGEFFDFDLEADEWPIEEKFDIILCFEVIEHLFRDPMRLFWEVNKHLEVGGKLILTTPNIASFRGIKALLCHYSPGLYVKYSGSKPLYTSHRTEFTIRDIQEFSRAAGFTAAIETFESYRSESSLELHKLLDACGLDVKLRGDTIFAVLTKETDPLDRFPESIYV